MRLLFLVLTCLVTSAQILPMGARTTFGSSWLHTRSIVIDHTKVSTNDQSNFTITWRSPKGTVNTVTTAATWASGDTFPTWMDAIDIAGTTYTFTRIDSTHGTLGSSAGTQTGSTYTGTPYLKTVANGGLLQSSSGYDMMITSDSGCTTKLNFERVVWVAASGSVELHFKETTLSHTVDTTAYLCYDNSAIVSDQQNATATWDSTYKAVWHMPDGTTFGANDSTSNANNSTNNHNITALAAQIDGGGTGANASSSHVDAGTDASLDPVGTKVLTVEMWVKRTANNSVGTFVARGTGGVGGWTVSLGVSPCTVNQVKMTKLGVADICLGSFPADTSWHQLTAVWNGTGQVVYVDGSSNGTAADTSNFAAVTTTLVMFAIDTSATQACDCSLDEVRISTATARTVDYVVTVYNNQNAPFTFYTLGSQT